MPYRRLISPGRKKAARVRAAGLLLVFAGLALGACASSEAPTLTEIASREMRVPETRVRDAPPPPGVDAALLRPVSEEDPLALLPFNAAVAQLSRAAGDRLAEQAPPLELVSDAQRARALRFYAAGRSRRLAGDAAGAIDDLRLAIESDPGAAPPYRELGEAHRSRGDRLAAVAAFRETLVRDPDDLTSLLAVGLSAGERGNHEVAAGLLSRAWERLGDSTDPALPYITSRFLGASLLELGSVRAGAEALRLSVDLPDEFTQSTSLAELLANVYRAQSDLWVQIGDAEARMGEFVAALEAYERAGAFPTFNPGALLPRRVYTAMRLGRPAAAAIAVAAELEALDGRADLIHFQLIAYLREQSGVGPALAAGIDEIDASLDPEQRRLVASRLLRARSAALPTEQAVTLLRTRLAEAPRDTEAIDAIYRRLQDAEDSRLLSETMSLIGAAPMQESRYTEWLLRVRPSPASLLETLGDQSISTSEPWVTDVLRARLLLESGDGEAGERVLRTLVQSGPAGPTAATLLAETLIRVGRSADATGPLEMLAESTDLEAVEARARILRAMGRYAAALEALEPLLDTTVDQPPRVGDLLLAGQLAQLTEQFEEAEHFFRLAISLDPTAEEGHAGLIGLYAPGGPLESRDQFTEAMRRLRVVAPSSRTIRWLRAQDLVTNAQYAEAERELLSLAEERATDPVASLLTTIWLRRGSGERAEAWLREKSAAEPGNPIFIQQLGRVLAATGRASEGAALLTEWLAERPSDVSVSRQLEQILRDALDRPEEADRIAMERLLRSPVSLARSLELATVLLNQGDLPSAMSTLREGLELDDPLNDAQRDALLQLVGAIGQAAVEGVDDPQQAVVPPASASTLMELVAARVAPLPGPVHASRVGLLVAVGAGDDDVYEAMRRARREQSAIAEQLTIWASRRLAAAERPVVALRVVEASIEEAPEPSAELIGAWLQQAFNARDAASSERAIRASHANGIVQEFAVGENDQRLSRDDAAAELSYTFALALGAVDDEVGQQRLYDLALSFNPRHAMTNNNVGYGMADRGENLGEAHRMLIVAYEERPTDGAVVDSLGWVRYRLGILRDELNEDGEVVREGALTLLRRATELVESREDPIVHDHLGDAYWAAGRTEDAERQWAIAAALIDSLEPEMRAIRPDLNALEETVDAKIEAAAAGEDPPIAEILGDEQQRQAEALQDAAPAGDG